MSHADVCELGVQAEQQGRSVLTVFAVALRQGGKLTDRGLSHLLHC